MFTKSKAFKIFTASAISMAMLSSPASARFVPGIFGSFERSSDIIGTSGVSSFSRNNFTRFATPAEPSFDLFFGFSNSLFSIDNLIASLPATSVSTNADLMTAALSNNVGSTAPSTTPASVDLIETQIGSAATITSMAVPTAMTQTAAGSGSSAFSVDVDASINGGNAVLLAEQVTQTPLPGAFPLMLSAIIGGAVAARSRKKETSK